LSGVIAGNNAAASRGAGVVAMRAVLESTFADIDQQLNVTLSATKMRLYRALDKLTCLADYSGLDIQSMAMV
jgi:DNA-directed RNA polymerase specialized sigma24 family protein